MVRDITRDLVRGSAVVEMELANHLGWFKHAPPGANDLTYADTVFPTFMFLSGMGPIRVYRSITLVGLGLEVNRIKTPYKQPVRIYGVLQRIGLSGLLLGGVASGTTSIWFPIACATTWAVISYKLAENKQKPFRDPGGSAQTRIDRIVTAGVTMYREDYDPEGLLGTLTAACTMWFGHFIAANPLGINESIVTGLSLMSFGYMISYAFPRACPLSKTFWTPSYALSTSGLVLVKYAVTKLAVPYLPVFVQFPIECLGKRALEVYLLSALVDRSSIRQLIEKPFGKRKIGKIVSTAVCTAFLTASAWALVNWNLKI